MNPFTWIEVRTAAQAVAELAQPRGGLAALKAGGLDLLDRMKEGLDQPARLINLRRLTDHGMAEVRELADPPRLHIGALVTLARLAEDPLVRRHAPALAQAAAGAATPQIRQVATLGGNLLQRPRCWYLRSAAHPCKKKGGKVCFAQEGENELHALFDNAGCAAVHPSSAATALVALDAGLEVLGAGGLRRMPIAELAVSPGQPGFGFTRDHRLGPAEVLTGVQVPLTGARSVYRKIKQKQSFDWPLCEVAVSIQAGQAGQGLSAARIVLGAVAPVPWRATAAEAELLKSGRGADAAGIRRAAQAAVRGARPLQHNGYKVALCVTLVERALTVALSGRPDPSPDGSGEEEGHG
jgi:xanthine dehydrogenase YagS FAD-binding subunit